MKNKTKMTPAERAEMEAKVAALRLEAKKLNAFLREDAAKVSDEEVPAVAEAIEEVSDEEIFDEAEAEAVTEEVAPVEVEAEAVTEEVAPVEVEAEAVTEEVAPVEVEAEEVTEEEAPVEVEAEEVTEEEAPVEAEAEEVTEEEAPVEAEAEEVTEEEASVEAEAEEVTEEEAPVEAEAEEAPVEEAPVEAEAEEVTEEEAPVEAEKKPLLHNIFKGGAVALGLVAVICLLAFIASTMRKQPTVDPTPDDNNPVVTPGGDTVEQPNALAMDAFKTSVANIAAQLSDDESIAANVDIFVEKIGEDKLVELIDKYGELQTQKAIAEFVAFVPEVKLQQYISNNALDYNPNALEDYYAKLMEIDEIYTEATGKNPTGALMSLEGYDAFKGSRDAIKTMIVESGDLLLLAWYEAKNETDDTMYKQVRDTDKADAYKEEVKLEIVNSNGSIKLLELQLEKEVNAELTAMDNVSMQYTEAYNQFVLDNYLYVVANRT